MTDHEALMRTIRSAQKTIDDAARLGRPINLPELLAIRDLVLASREASRSEDMEAQLAAGAAIGSVR